MGISINDQKIEIINFLFDFRLIVSVLIRNQKSVFNYNFQNSFQIVNVYCGFI